MNAWYQQWQNLNNKTLQLQSLLQAPADNILKSVPLYWADDLKKWIDYKEQVLFPRWRDEHHPLMSIIPTLQRDHQLLTIVADRFVFDPSVRTYQSFLKIAAQMLGYEQKVLWPKLNEYDIRQSLP